MKMTKEEYKDLLTVIRTSINMTDVSREAKKEATYEIQKVLVKKINEK